MSRKSVSVLHHKGGVQANRSGARSCCQSPTSNAVRNIVPKKVMWRAVVEMVPACS